MLDAAYTTLLDARVVLQRLTSRPANVLTLEHQAGVAASLGLSGADELMARIAEAARAIAWTGDDAWRRRSVPRVRAGSSRSRPIGPGLRIEGAGVSLADEADLRDPALVSARRSPRPGRAS